MFEKHSGHWAVAKCDSKHISEENIPQIKWNCAPVNEIIEVEFKKRAFHKNFYCLGQLQCLALAVFKHFFIMALYGNESVPVSSQRYSFELLWRSVLGKRLLNPTQCFENLPPSVLENYSSHVERTRRKEVINWGEMFQKKKKRWGEGLKHKMFKSEYL